MNLIFIHLGTKKIDYLSDSIQQALFFNSKIKIFLVSNKNTYDKVNYKIKRKIIFENIKNLKISNNHKNFINNNLLDKSGIKVSGLTPPKGFLSRKLSKKYKLKNIIHIENDILPILTC